MPPPFEDPLRAYRADLARRTILALLAFEILFALWMAASVLPWGDLRLTVLLVMLAGTLCAGLILRRGRVALAGWTILLLYWGGLTAILLRGGVRAPAFGTFLPLCLLAAVLVGFRSALATAALSLLTGAGLLIAETRGLLPISPNTITPQSAFGAWVFIFGLSALLLALMSRETRVAMRLARQEIANRKQAEEALQHSLERFSSAFELSPLLMSITRMSDGLFIEANQNFTAILGYPREQVIGRRPADINLWADPADRERLRAELREKGQVTQMQTRVNTRNGEIRDMLISARTLDVEGEPCILIVGTDITDRMAAEAALRESEERYRLLVELAPYGIAVHQDGKIVFANQAGARLIGAESPQQVIGMSITEIIAPENLAAASERIRRMLQGERGLYPTEDVYVRLDGSRVPVEVIAAPFTFKGRPAVQVIVQDITERKQAEQALKESEARYRQLFEDAADGLLVLDAENNILDLNGRICQMLGYDRETLRGINAIELLHPEDLASKDHAAAYQALMRGETVLSNYRLKKRDGTYLPTELSTKWLGGNRFLNIVRDITERVRSAAELEESRKRLRELARYLQTARENERKAIAREIHDDLGQRLTGLKIETVRLADLLPEERLDLAARAARMSLAIDETIDRVRNLSSRLRPGLLDDLGLIPALEWLGEDFDARTGIACELHLPQEAPEIPPEIATDTYRICQEALTNVVRHAGASRVVIRLTIEPDGLHLMVQDDGRGISTAELQHRDALGILGMQERALQWNGTISFDGEPGQGTTVRLHIPLDVRS